MDKKIGIIFPTGAVKTEFLLRLLKSKNGLIAYFNSEALQQLPVKTELETILEWINPT